MYKVNIIFEMSEGTFKYQREIAEKLTNNKMTNLYDVIKDRAIELANKTHLKCKRIVVFKIEETRKVL